MDHNDQPGPDAVSTQHEMESCAKTLCAETLTGGINVGDETAAIEATDPVLASVLELVVTPRKPLSETLFEMRGR
ncbi:hypothetical protein pqer_cds_876 [Pandoravirus quercus]|uniref:Uncharacterized protein n=1 Tax=Pandoravirus quercus TaxID=2107709 RepID=A0A2U7UA18_9VIRU|nr:hypothetical protein pqer_cds_876 [Pandoravirus quercus]AVK75298.1 hypothetical protein pqer_cds_876 [Pandoravirus quercus]